MKLLRSHGISRDRKLMTKSSEGEWYYKQIDLGFNYRMTELQAALGISQMRRLDEFVLTRHNLRKQYDNLFENLKIKIPFQSPDSYSALHLYPIQLIDNLKSRIKVYNELRLNGIGVNVHYIPIYNQPFYQSMGFDKALFPNTENYYKNAISIPLYYGLSRSKQLKIVNTLKSILS